MDMIEALAVAAICALKARFFLHMAQLEGYRPESYSSWLRKNTDKLFGWTVNLGVAASVVYFALSLLTAPLGSGPLLAARIAILVCFMLVVLFFDMRQGKEPEKKPMVYTARMKRLYAAFAIVTLAATRFIQLLSVPAYLAFAAIPYMLVAALWLMWPIENIINDRYKSLAAVKLAGRPDLIRIGITGSYGKTSAKFILNAILSEKFDVLASPSSINTPMGLTIMIREQLEQHHQVLIAEMGARRVGEIRELAELIKPRYGVITSIGPQHLETFGSLENVAKTKFELIEELPGDGVGFFGADDGETDKLYEKAACEKYRAGIGGGFLYMRAEDIEVGEFGSRFTLRDNEGNRAVCETKLLGRHNIANIVLCCAVAARLGMSMEQIARGIKRIRPIEHRLMLMRGESGEPLVIDDAFNSNPAGAKAALDVLAQFKNRRRLIVTPGMVELGDKQNDFNYKFGAQIAMCCDIAVLVGSTCSRAIAQGAVDSGMAIENIHFVANLKDAAALLRNIGRETDIILFENDLPDNYS